MIKLIDRLQFASALVRYGVIWFQFGLMLSFLLKIWSILMNS